MCCSFMKAAWKKYHDDMSLEDAEAIHSVPKEGPAKLTDTGHLLLPAHVHLPRLGINKALCEEDGETEEDLMAMVLGVTDLDLSGNSLATLVEVIKIIRCMPKLSFLDLTRNPLRASTVLLAAAQAETLAAHSNATGNAKSVQPCATPQVVQAYGSSSAPTKLQEMLLDLDTLGKKDEATNTECMCSGLETEFDDCDCCDDDNEEEDEDGQIVLRNSVEGKTCREICQALPPSLSELREAQKIASKKDVLEKINQVSNDKNTDSVAVGLSYPNLTVQRDRPNSQSPQPEPLANVPKEPMDTVGLSTKQPVKTGDLPKLPVDTTRQPVDTRENLPNLPVTEKTANDTFLDMGRGAVTHSVDVVSTSEVAKTSAGTCAESHSVGCQCVKVGSTKCCAQQEECSAHSVNSSARDSLQRAKSSCCHRHKYKLIPASELPTKYDPVQSDSTHDRIEGDDYRDNTSNIYGELGTVSKADPKSGSQQSQPRAAGILKEGAHPTEQPLKQTSNVNGQDRTHIQLIASPYLQKDPTSTFTAAEDLEKKNMKGSDALPTLSHLVLNATGLAWSGVSGLLGMFTQLVELHLSLNDYSIVELPQGFCYPSLQRLFFNSNPVKEWGELSKLGLAFPGLKVLYMAETPIHSLGDRQSLQKSFPALEVLSLNRTQLCSWEEVDKLRQFGSLKDVRLASIAFLDKQDELERHQQLVARLPNVTQLNGSTVSEDERVDAEKAFLRKFHFSDKPERYFELEKVYGPMEPLTDNMSGPQQTLFNITVRMNSRSKLVLADINETVQDFKQSLAEWAGLIPAQFVLYYSDRQGTPTPPVKLKFLDKKLAAYDIHDGDEFILELKHPEEQFS